MLAISIKYVLSKVRLEGFYFMDWTSIIGAFLGGSLFGSLITYQVTKKNLSSSNGGSSTDQSGAKAGGDIVGRDKRH